MFRGIDLSSDTVTRPTPGMRRAMAEAEVGDEQKGEDPTTCQLEELTAGILGKTTAIFVPSATMANQLAVLAATEPGDELMAAENCHIFIAETGGSAVHAGVMSRPIRTESGIFTAEEVRAHYLWARAPHHPTSKLLCVENTTNMGGGQVWPQATLEGVLSAASTLGLKTHLDGARLFNAAVASGRSPEQIASGFDSVTLCLSKGLGAPVGAVLAFDQSQFEKIRRLKQRMGGSMRQSGCLAAAGVYALKNHVERLAEDHLHARELADRLSDGIPYIEVENNPPSTNMVFFRWLAGSVTCSQFLENCARRGVRFSQAGVNRIRAVTHLDIKREDIAAAVRLVKEACSQL